MPWFCRIISRQITVVFTLLYIVGLHGLWDKGGPVGQCEDCTSLPFSNWGMSPLNSLTCSSLKCIRNLIVKCKKVFFVVLHTNVYTHWLLPVSMDVVHLTLNSDIGDLWPMASFLGLWPWRVHRLVHRCASTRDCHCEILFLSATATTVIKVHYCCSVHVKVHYLPGYSHIESWQTRTQIIP